MSAPRDPDRAFFGHPSGLSTLFFTEMWERFSYYGLRAFLIFYMTATAAKGGLGMTLTTGGVVLALYTASVYMLSLPGGWIADRFVGQRRAVMIGGLGIMLGSVLLALPVEGLFYPALAVTAIGTGFLKPNVSTLVGQLYKPDDPRRDAGFTIYYVGINIGAWAAPIACGFLAQSDTFREVLGNFGLDPNLCWHFAFGMAAIGMAVGLIQYQLGGKRLGTTGLHPTIPSDPRAAARDRVVLIAVGALLGGVIVLAAVLMALDISVSKDLIANIFGIGLIVGAIVLFVGMYMGARDAGEKRRILAMIPLFIGGIAFFATFEQASSTLNIFAERCVRQIVPSSYYQTINATFIVFLAPVAAAIWLRLGKARKEPSSVNKFGIGMIFTACAFASLVPTIHAISQIVTAGQPLAILGSGIDGLKYEATKAAVDNAVNNIGTPLRVSPAFLFILYFFQTTSELCISPVGLSSMSKLAPQRMAGMVMGTWFLATAIGNYLAGRAAGVVEQRGFGFLFVCLIVASLVMAAALFAVAPMIKKMMGSGNGDDTDGVGPEERRADAADLPVATALKVD